MAVIAADRALLELAAKAAGAPWPVRGFDYGGDDRAAAVLFEVGALAPFRWNPLTDDGDALRLAAAIGQLNLAHLLSPYGDPDLYKTDPAPAIRRAIVLASAAAGRAMP